MVILVHGKLCSVTLRALFRFDFYLIVLIYESKYVQTWHVMYLIPTKFALAGRNHP